MVDNHHSQKGVAMSQTVPMMPHDSEKTPGVVPSTMTEDKTRSQAMAHSSIVQDKNLGMATSMPYLFKPVPLGGNRQERTSTNSRTTLRVSFIAFVFWKPMQFPPKEHPKEQPTKETSPI